MKGFVKSGLALTALLFVLALVNEPAGQARAVIMHRENVPVYVTAPRDSGFWFQLIDHFSAEYDVPSPLLRVIFRMESSDGVNAFAFNPHKLKSAKKKSNDPLERRMLASALCPFQVLGLTAKEIGVGWQEIAFDPVECVRTATYHVRKLLDRHSRLSKQEQLRSTLRDYYGRDANGEKYATKGMTLLAQMRTARSHS